MKEEHVNPCMSCPGYCCFRNLIDVCGYDVWLIVHQLTLHPTDFLSCMQLPEDNKYCFRLSASGQSYQLILSMKEATDGSHRCLFGLNLPNQQFRCGIYPVRPLGCKSYPFALHKKEVVTKPKALCPQGEWNIDNDIIPSVKETIDQTDMEYDIYGRIVELWNSNVADQPIKGRINFRPFITYMMNFYDRLDGVRRLVPEDAWPAIYCTWKSLILDGNNPLMCTKIEATDAWHDWITGTAKILGDTRELYWPDRT